MTTPVELLVLADGYRLDGVELCLVSGQHQYPGIVAARLRIRCRIDIATRIPERVRLCLSVQHVLPVIRMGPIQYTVLHILATRVLHDRDRIDCVSAQYVFIHTGVAVCTTVEGDTLPFA